MNTAVHAPDGGRLDHALCEETDCVIVGDEADVTCPECLYQLDELRHEIGTSPRSEERFARLVGCGFDVDPAVQ